MTKEYAEHLLAVSFNAFACFARDNNVRTDGDACPAAAIVFPNAYDRDCAFKVAATKFSCRFDIKSIFVAGFQVFFITLSDPAQWASLRFLIAVLESAIPHDNYALLKTRMCWPGFDKCPLLHFHALLDPATDRLQEESVQSARRSLKNLSEGKSGSFDPNNAFIDNSDEAKAIREAQHREKENIDRYNKRMREAYFDGILLTPDEAAEMHRHLATLTREWTLEEQLTQIANLVDSKLATSNTARTALLEKVRLLAECHKASEDRAADLTSKEQDNRADMLRQCNGVGMPVIRVRQTKFEYTPPAQAICDL